MVDLMHLGAFSIIFIAVLGFVSNQNATNQNAIQVQFLKLSCPLPIREGTVVNGTLTFNGNTLTYELTHGHDINGNPTSVEKDQVGSYFRCGEDNAFTADVTTKQYSAVDNTFGFPIGWFGYTSDTITAIIQKVVALFTIMSSYLTPVDFNILGFTLADLGPVATMAVISIYIFCYIMIALLIYKVISPFSGVG